MHHVSSFDHWGAAHRLFPCKHRRLSQHVLPQPRRRPRQRGGQLARWGFRGFIGKVGQDDFGLSLKKCLEENNVSTKGLVMDKRHHTTLAFVQLDEHGDRSFTFYRDPGADTQLLPEEVNMEEVEECSILHFGSLSLTNDPSRSTTLSLVEKARKMGKLISYDPNWRAGVVALGRGGRGWDEAWASPVRRAEDQRGGAGPAPPARRASPPG